MRAQVISQVQVGNIESRSLPRGSLPKLRRMSSCGVSVWMAPAGPGVDRNSKRDSRAALMMTTAIRRAMLFGYQQNNTTDTRYADY
jgi:hypothetical protein